MGKNHVATIPSERGWAFSTINNTTRLVGNTDTDKDNWKLIDTANFKKLFDGEPLTVPKKHEGTNNTMKVFPLDP